jgi:hypothetical protein
LFTKSRVSLLPKVTIVTFRVSLVILNSRFGSV